MAHDIFISYSTHDEETALHICRLLEESGITCWIAKRNLLPGQTWAAAIEEAIGACRAVLVVVSAASIDSRQVGRELTIADHKGVGLIPVRFETVELRGELAFYLANKHWLDAFPGPLEEHAQRIVENVRSLLEKAPIKPVPGPPPSAKANRTRLRVGAAIAAITVVLAAVSWLFWHDYRVRVGVLDTEGRHVEEAAISSRPTGKVRKTPEGWEITIPHNSKPADGRLNVSASSTDGNLTGSADVQLAAYRAAQVVIQLRRPPDSTVHGTVLDAAGRLLAGARVSIAGYEREAVVTGTNGAFELPAHDTAGSVVVLHVEKDGFPPIDRRHFAGPEPATITFP